MISGLRIPGSNLERENHDPGVRVKKTMAALVSAGKIPEARTIAREIEDGYTQAHAYLAIYEGTRDQSDRSAVMKAARLAHSDHARDAVYAQIEELEGFPISQSA